MKKITSLSLGLAFLIMSYTGIMLFICPHGRVAYWSDWHLFGLSKGQYGEIHTTSMLVFLFFGALHIYYNWKPIMSYMKDKSKKISFTKKEFVIALALNVVFLVGTLYAIQPFKGFLDLGEGIKDTWTKQYGEPPYGHAELTKLKVFCKKMDIDLTEAKENLRKNNIVFDENDTLQEIARKNKTSPSAIYEFIRKEKAPDDGTPENLGRKTLKELSDMKKIDLEHSLKFIKEKGISDVDPDNRMRELADELEIEPLELYKSIKL